MLTTLLTLSVTAAPIPVEPGQSIAGVRIGMTRAEVGRLHKLTPEGMERAQRTGYVSGPLLFLFDTNDVVVLVSVELQKTAGLRIGKLKVPSRISAADFAKLVPSCTLSRGSGGHAIHCSDGLDAYGGKFVSSVHLGPG